MSDRPGRAVGRVGPLHDRVGPGAAAEPARAGCPDRAQPADRHAVAAQLRAPRRRLVQGVALPRQVDVTILRPPSQAATGSGERAVAARGDDPRAAGELGEADTGAPYRPQAVNRTAQHHAEHGIQHACRLPRIGDELVSDRGIHSAAPRVPSVGDPTLGARTARSGLLSEPGHLAEGAATTPYLAARWTTISAVSMLPLTLASTVASCSVFTPVMEPFLPSTRTRVVGSTA